MKEILDAVDQMHGHLVVPKFNYTQPRTEEEKEKRDVAYFVHLYKHKGKLFEALRRKGFREWKENEHIVFEKEFPEGTEIHSFLIPEDAPGHMNVFSTFNFNNHPFAEYLKTSINTHTVGSSELKKEVTLGFKFPGILRTNELRKKLESNGYEIDLSNTHTIFLNDRQQYFTVFKKGKPVAAIQGTNNFKITFFNGLTATLERNLLSLFIPLKPNLKPSRN